MLIDLRVTELLASKLCHDLISPVSAINNGVELIEDIGESVTGEAMKLIGDSAGVASRRLRLFRMAYGRAGSEESLTVRDIRPVGEQYIAGGKVTLSWPDGALPEALASLRGSLKVVLNMLILAEELLPYGGTVTLAAEGDKGCRMSLAGRNAQMPEAYQAALTGTVAVEDLTPRTIQAYITGKFAAEFGLILRHEQAGEERLDLVLAAEAKVPSAP